MSGQRLARPGDAAGVDAPNHVLGSLFITLGVKGAGGGVPIVQSGDRMLFDPEELDYALEYFNSRGLGDSGVSIEEMR